MNVYLIASLTPRPEHVAELEAALRELVAASRSEPGNLRYDLLHRADGQPGFYVYEIYADDAAVEAHRQSAHYAAFGAKAKAGDWLAGAPDVKVLKGVDVAA
ncbi:putative quinol monooxygenase [Paraburkholderia ferrariae]|jgi:quinol monooxygenase YgiN|uniref:putative quinol monooxygenase n=1 Tax=Paraburkholderia ferrariae TaxID=386056 RepID=UPI000489A7CC|nr:putative quinol monooxygenase [Paraburkholderia ferrariae]